VSRPFNPVMLECVEAFVLGMFECWAFVLGMFECWAFVLGMFECWAFILGMFECWAFVPIMFEHCAFVFDVLECIRVFCCLFLMCLSVSGFCYWYV